MNRRAETKDQDLVFALLATAALVSVWTALSVGVNGRTDFRGFFESAQRWNAGADPYATFSGNLNPPLVTALLFRPLTALPFLAAFLVWAAVSLIAWLAIVRVLPAERRLGWLVASATCGS